MPDFDYDLLVIGSGPGGLRAAYHAAKMNKKVAIVERKSVVGGVSVNVGTIPSKTLREAVMELSGYHGKTFYGQSFQVKETITIDDLFRRTNHVIQHEIDVLRSQMARNGIELIQATASFADEHTVNLEAVDGRGLRLARARYIIIAVGTRATRDPHIPFDGRTIFTSDDILTLDRLPKTLAVIGGGVIGTEYTSMFAALGIRVTLVEKHPRLLTFVDHEIVDDLVYHLRGNRVVLRLGETVSGVQKVAADGGGEGVRIMLASGKTIAVEKVLFSIGRTGNTERLQLECAGLQADSRGRLKVNENYQTAVPHIYAVGDVIGFPSLSSTSMEQGRLAASHAFGLPVRSFPELFPYGIYSIPEVSMCGRTEEELTQEGVPYEIGKARFREIARGQIVGDTTGMLKLCVHAETRELLGVHIIGFNASELVHIGQAVMAYRGTIDYFVDTVFNYPTLAEGYKIAALDAANRLRAYGGGS
jgi:NAD(P) transhydrogenase